MALLKHSPLNRAQMQEVLEKHQVKLIRRKAWPREEDYKLMIEDTVEEITGQNFIIGHKDVHEISDYLDCIN